MTDVPNINKWTVDEMMRTTFLLQHIAEQIAAETMLSLMMGELREAPVDEAALDGLRKLAAEIREEDGDVSVERFASVIEVMAATSATMFKGLIEAMRLTGLMMPDPDSMAIPDSVPEEWGES